MTLRRFLDELNTARHVPGRQQYGWLSLSGGVSYGYVGHATVSVFVLICISWFVPLLGAYGTGLYIFLAYPYLYGYYRPSPETGRPPEIEPQPGGNTEDARVLTKVSSSIQVQGILIAVVVLLLTITLLWNPHTAYGGQHFALGFAGFDSYRLLMEPVLVTLAMIAIICWILSMDILDTAMNRFPHDTKRSKNDELPNYPQYFFRLMGPAGLRPRRRRADEPVNERTVARLEPDRWTPWPTVLLAVVFVGAPIFLQLT